MFIRSTSASDPDWSCSCWWHICASGTNSSRPWGLHWRRCHLECSRHCNRQSVFCCTSSNSQCASFADMYHLVDTSSRTCGHKGGLLQLSSLVGISGQLLQRLQSVFNAAARFMFLARKSEHVTPFLHELHRLKVPERIQFRLWILAYRCLNGMAPSYLAETLHLTADVGSHRHLLTASMSTLVVPSTRCTTLGDRAFPVAAARAWNVLPPSVCSVTSLLQFCRDLKMSLFQSLCDRL